jgi:hypothetical protein
MSKTYELVNPLILGTFDRKFTADNSLQAAHLAYQNISQYFTGHMPRYKFTLQRVKSNYQIGGGKSDDYLHFETYEKKKKIDGKNVKGIEYVIKPIKSSTNIDNFQQKLQNFLERKKLSTVPMTSEESESESESESEQRGGSNLLNFLGEHQNSNLEMEGGKKKYVEDEELDPELEKLLFEDDDSIRPKKKKTKKGWTPITGPLKGQVIYPSPITYYRYDPVLYTEYINYVPVFTEEGRPKRMVYDIYTISSLMPRKD